MSVEQVILFGIGLIGSLISYVFKSTLADIRRDIQELKEADKGVNENIAEIGQDIGKWTAYQEKNFLRKEDAKDLYQRKSNPGE